MNNYLENQINQMIDFINNNNLGFGLKLNALRNHKGIYISGEPFDYLIITKHGIVCFDAKQTIQTKWNILKKDKKQLHNLLKIKKLNNSKCFIIIYFITKNKLMKINCEDVLKILKTRKHIKISDCNIWNWKEDLI